MNEKMGCRSRRVGDVAREEKAKDICVIYEGSPCTRECKNCYGLSNIKRFNKVAAWHLAEIEKAKKEARVEVVREILIEIKDREKKDNGWEIMENLIDYCNELINKANE